MEYIIYIVIFLIVFLPIVILYSEVSYKNDILKNKFKDISSIAEDATTSEFRASYMDRVIRPAYQKILNVITMLAPVRIKERYQHIIITSGSLKKVTVSGIIMMQVMFAIIFGILTFLISKYILGETKALFVILMFLFGFFIPIRNFYSKSSKRKKKIVSELPDFLDLLYLSVEAGLGFDQAMRSTSDRMKGILGEEIRKTMGEIVRGREREEAFRGLEKRTGVDEVKSFTVAVIQTESLGSNISSMLRAQSTMMRMKRRQRAEEMAAKMSIKMLFPLIICFLPAMFVVILGPGVINIIQTLMGLSD